MDKGGELSGFGTAMTLIIIGALLIGIGYWWGSHANATYTNDTEYMKVTIVKLTQTSSNYEVTIDYPISFSGVREFTFTVENKALFDSFKLGQVIEVVKLNGEWRVVYQK